MDYRIGVFTNLKLGLAVSIHHEVKRRSKLKQRSTWMLVVSQEMAMPRVPGIRELVRGRAPREHKLGDSPRPFLVPQVRLTKENEFLQHRMTKKAIIHVGFVEGSNLSGHFNFIC